MKKTSLLFIFLLSYTFVFSQTIFLDAGPLVPEDAPEGQPVLSYSLSDPAEGGLQELRLTLITGIMTPELIKAAASGTGFTKMELKFYDTQQKVYYKITLHEVMVSSYQSGTNMIDNVSLTFSRIKIKNSISNK